MKQLIRFILLLALIIACKPLQPDTYGDESDPKEGSGSGVSHPPAPPPTPPPTPPANPPPATPPTTTSNGGEQYPSETPKHNETETERKRRLKENDEKIRNPYEGAQIKEADGTVSGTYHIDDKGNGHWYNNNGDVYVPMELFPVTAGPNDESPPIAPPSINPPPINPPPITPSDPCGEGANPFDLNGNVTRKITDLSMTGSEPLQWIRYNNSMPRMIVPAFGQGASWRHNWQFELQAWSNEEGDHLLFIYPSGIRRTFDRLPDGSFVTLHERYTEKARLVGDRVEITTQGENILVFEPVTAPVSQATAGIYRVVTLTDKNGQVTNFDYDENSLLQQITNEAGNQITIYHEGHAGLPCISRVETSDGRAVEYEYNNMTAPSVTGFPLDNSGDEQEAQEYATLARVHYGDGTTAEYKYDFATSGLAPLLVEADDPRYNGRANHIGYRYQTERGYGVIHQEINPVTQQAYATLEFDPADPERRTVRYTDDRAIVYRVPAATNGRPTERVDSLGRKATWSYSNGGMESLEEETSIDGLNIKYTRDKKGQIIRATRSNGQVINIERDENGKEIKIKDNRGHSTEYVRDSKGRVVQATKTNSGKGKGVGKGNSANAPGQTKKQAFVYDAVGRLLRQDYDDGTYEEFARDNKGNTLTKRDRKGGIHQYTYAERGLVASETDPLGATTSYAYDIYGQIASRTDALGRVTTWDRNERGLVTKQTNPDGTTRLYYYDKYGRKTAETDEIGRTATWEYDSMGRMTYYTDFAGGVTRYDYTETPGGCGTCSLISNPTRIEYSDGHIDEFLYDSEGRKLMQAAAVGTAQMATTLYAYDDANNLIQQTNPDGGVIRHTYDSDRHRLSTTDALNRTTSWTYDTDGNILSQTDPSGRTIDYAYDASNNLIYAVTPDGVETTSEYDDANRRISATNALGNTTRWNYDAVGNLVSTIDAGGNKITYTYDSANRRTKAKFSDGTSQTWAYNAIGQVTQTTTPDGLIVTNEYDAMGRTNATTRTMKKNSQAASASTMRVTYDVAGRRTSVTDALGRTTTYEYNARNQVTTTTFPNGTQTHNEYDPATGRLAASIDALGNTTSYTYTAMGDMASLTDANGNTYAFEYDAMRRKTAMFYPDDTAEQWTYDVGGRLATYTTRAGQTKTITYNLDGKPVLETWLPFGCAPDITYTYDDVTGYLLNVDNGNTVLTYTYDKLGRLASETTTINSLHVSVVPHTVGYLYDSHGRKVGLVYPDGKKVTYTYDAQGRMTEVSNGGNKPLATYEYDAFRRRSQLTRDNGVVTSYDYDPASQLLSVNHKDKSNKTLAFATYQYDNMGRRTSMTRENLQTDYYTYDPTGQLVGVDYGTPYSGGTGVLPGSAGVPPADESRPATRPLSESLSYDPLGNRITHTALTADGTPEITQYQTNNLNQYTNITQSGSAEIPLGTTPQTHDENGNLTDDGKQIYRYDAQNRLVEVESETTKAVFTYDARNRCVIRQYYTRDNNGDFIIDATNSVVMTYDTDWNILADRNLSGRQTASYIHGNTTDEILAQVRDSETVYPLADALGSTIMLAGQNGGNIGVYTYTAFGRPSVAGGNNRYLYTGREWLGTVGLNEHRNRYYNPNTGRWPSTDLIGFKGKDQNLYRYVKNSPANFVDPKGLFGDGQSFGPESDPNSQWKGHSDFYGSGCFNYTAEDHDPATDPFPGGNPAGHFQDYATSSAQVETATNNCDPDAFERAMHRLQDFYSHYNKGYRWGADRINVDGPVVNPEGICHLGHVFAGTIPDHDNAAWEEANKETIKRVDDYISKCGPPSTICDDTL